MQANQRNTDPPIPIQSHADITIGIAPDSPFCFNPKCSCHQNQQLIAGVIQHTWEGSLTLQEATLFVQGKTI